MSLLVTGSIAIDSVETPFGDVQEVLGGAAAYFSVAASFFCPVRLLGVVGEDFPPAFRKVLADRNIDLSGLEVRLGSKTFRWVGRYQGSMADAETKDVQLNVLAESAPKAPEKFRDSEFVFLANSHPGLQLELLGELSGPRLVAADTRDFWIDNEPQALREVLSKVDGLVINQAEAFQLTGEHNTPRAGRQILKMGPRFVVVKKGEHGCLLVSEEDMCMLPAFPAEEVKDPTGAGDAFAGGLMGYLANVNAVGGRDLRRALAYGTVTASFAIEGFSLEGLLCIGRNDVDEAFEDYTAMLRLS